MHAFSYMSLQKQKVALARFNTPEAFVEAPGFCAANLAKTSREPAATTDASEFSTFLRKALQPVLVGAPPPQPAGGKAEVQRFRSCLVVSVLQTQCNLCQHKDKKAKCCITQEQKVRGMLAHMNVCMCLRQRPRTACMLRHVRHACKNHVCFLLMCMVPCRLSAWSTCELLPHRQSACIANCE